MRIYQYLAEKLWRVNVTTAEVAGTKKLIFEDLVREHQGMVFSIAYHFLRDRMAAEEVAQDAFMDLYKDLPSLKSPEHAVFWLRRVTCHRSIDYARRNRTAPEVTWDQMQEPSQLAETGDPILSKRLGQVVASLPEKMRAVVILRYQEDVESEEIAKLLGMPLNTVKSHLHRALAMLRSKIEHGMVKTGI